MATLPKEVLALLKDEGSTKILATVDQSGMPNVTVKGSLSALDESTLILADVGGEKTRTLRNMQQTKKVAVLVTKGIAAYQIKGVYKGTETSGPVFNQFAAALKKAANIEIKGVDLITVEEVYSQNPMDLGKRLA